MTRALIAVALLSLGELSSPAWAAPARPKSTPPLPNPPPPQPPPAADAPKAPVPRSAVYLFNLSDFHGDVKGGFMRLAYDRARDEVYVMGGSPDVRVFGETGMEIYRFGDAQGLSYVRGVAPLPNGDLVAVTGGPDGTQVVRCNYRGEVKGPIPFSGFPPGVAPGMDDMRAVGGRLYFVDMRSFRVVATDEFGRYIFHRDLAKPIFRDAGPDAEESPTGETDITGFDVDDKGNLLLTIATQFRGLAISPQGDARAFGGKGSRAGKFNIAGAVAHDEDGNIYVADTLRSVIMVFTPDLKFMFQFGDRRGPGRLLLPYSIVVGNGKVFVSQGATRGVAVFKIE